MWAQEATAHHQPAIRRPDTLGIAYVARYRSGHAEANGSRSGSGSRRRRSSLDSGQDGQTPGGPRGSGAPAAQGSGRHSHPSWGTTPNGRATRHDSHCGAGQAGLAQRVPKYMLALRDAGAFSFQSTMPDLLLALVHLRCVPKAQLCRRQWRSPTSLSKRGAASRALA